MTDLEKLALHIGKIEGQLERIEHLLRSLWEDQQLDRIEDHVRHLRYGWAGAKPDSAPAEPVECPAWEDGLPYEQHLRANDECLERLQSAFEKQNWAAAGGQAPDWAKPDSASAADPRAQKTDRASDP